MTDPQPKDYYIGRCLEVGCEYTAAYLSQEAARGAADYHVRRERHFSGAKVRKMDQIAIEYFSAMDAIDRADV